MTRPTPSAVERVLVARLRGGQHVQVLDALVADQRLLQLGLVADHVDEVVDDPALAAHDQVQVAQADVEVDRDGLEPGLGDPGGDVGAGGGLADPALTRGDDDDFGHYEASFGDCKTHSTVVPSHCQIFFDHKRR